MEEERSRYRSGHFNGKKMEGKWSCYIGGQFKEGEWSYYVGSQFNGGRMIMLQRWIVSSSENGHVTEVVTNGGRMVMLQKWSLME